MADQRQQFRIDRDMLPVLRRIHKLFQKAGYTFSLNAIVCMAVRRGAKVLLDECNNCYGYAKPRHRKDDAARNRQVH